MQAHPIPLSGPPNIVYLLVDNLGYGELGCYGGGILRGADTRRIDAFATEGLKLLNFVPGAQCTPSRSALMTGRYKPRTSSSFIVRQTAKCTGLSKVGLPGATVGLQDRDITIAHALESLGCTTGQFGNSHRGDRDECLPSNHRFDEFLGNLYRLNAEEEPEAPTFPKNAWSGCSTAKRLRRAELPPPLPARAMRKSWVCPWAT